MKRLLLVLLIFVHAANSWAEDPFEHCFFITGASFAVSENGWFELLCEAFNARPVNRAVEGEAIMQAAVKMYDGTLYTADELEEMDAFIIMQVHNQNVANAEWLKDDYREYEKSSLQTNYAIAYDYVIKKYRDDCLQLKDNPASAYYGTEGKPANIFLCTHWHDARTTYNPAIRTLATKFDLPLIKWDENIGFTKNTLDDDGRQPSVKFSRDTEKIPASTGTVYGWHPSRGKGQYIQQKMAAIAMAELEKLFGERPVSASVHSGTKLLFAGEEASVAFSFTGLPPFSLAYSVNGEVQELENIETSPAFVPVALSASGEATVEPVSVSNARTDGETSGAVRIATATRPLSPTMDTYVHQAFTSNSYTSDTFFQLKLAGASAGYGRESYVSFDISTLTDDDEAYVFRAFFYEIIYPDNKKIREPHRVEIAGELKNYSGLKWSSRPTTSMTPIDTVAICYDELGTYIAWDVTEWLKAGRQAEATVVTFRLKIVSQGSGLLNFYAVESSEGYPSQLLVKQRINTGREIIAPDNGADNDGSVFFGIDGRRLHRLSPSMPGLYLQQTREGRLVKIIKTIH
jgi:hypothetical protein